MFLHQSISEPLNISGDYWECDGKRHLRQSAYCVAFDNQVQWVQWMKIVGWSLILLKSPITSEMAYGAGYDTAKPMQH